MSFGRYEKVLAGNRCLTGATYDLVAVMGGEPAAMFDMGIQALGGMGTFVAKGQKVLVKPNIGWDVVPEKGANTHPALVKADNRTLHQGRSQGGLCLRQYMR
ncbi:MAG: hypothetical protein MZV63_61815 [Marinilabiliales bacterium]|nr:hypothetical protein [Marinilabiliales bacterium]